MINTAALQQPCSAPACSSARAAALPSFSSVTGQSHLSCTSCPTCVPVLYRSAPPLETKPVRVSTKPGRAMAMPLTSSRCGKYRVYNVLRKCSCVSCGVGTDPASVRFNPSSITEYLISVPPTSKTMTFIVPASAHVISGFIMANCVWNVKRKAEKTVRLYKLLFSRKNSPERSADLSRL